MSRRKPKNGLVQGFTLIELLVVISVIGLLSSVLLVSFMDAREAAHRVSALANIKQMQKALELYFDSVDFYPPDVARGWDPGLAKALPYNISNSAQDCNTNHPACVCGNYLSCSSLPASIPANWIAVNQAKWRGPYLASWPIKTPWGGVYDYNHWEVATNRNGCIVPPGIYLGLQSGSGFTLDPAVELKLNNDGFDNDGCASNGEAQILLVKFP